MIGIKGGTQTWSNSPQRSDFKSDGAQNLSANDRGRVLGDDSIGDALNKVADPNYIDAGKKMRTVGNNQLGKDAFMSLLLTQMKNQDPTNPLKSHEMAAQLAQFTSLEKLNNINEGIEALRKDQQPSHNFEALSFIGKTISTDNGKVSHLEKEAHHELRFTLPNDAQYLTAQIKDAEGNPVRTLEFKNLKAGANEIAWNGLNNEGNTASVGEYHVAYEAVGSNGRKLNVETKTDGVITGVNFTPRGPQLLVGKHVVNMADVKSISDSSAAEMAQPHARNEIPQAGMPVVPSTAAPGMGGEAAEQLPAALSRLAGGQAPTPKAAAFKPIQVKPESKAEAAKRAKLSKGDINDAAMAQGLINQLNKAGAKAGMEG